MLSTLTDANLAFGYAFKNCLGAETASFHLHSKAEIFGPLFSITSISCPVRVRQNIIAGGKISKEPFFIRSLTKKFSKIAPLSLRSGIGETMSTKALRTPISRKNILKPFLISLRGLLEKE